MSQNSNALLAVILVALTIVLGACDAASPAIWAPGPGSVSDPNNIAPTASLAADTVRGSAPLQVQFDASSSADPDGRIVSYAYDFDGIDPYDEIGTSPQISHSFTEPGLYGIRVLVIDDKGAQAKLTLDVDVNALGNAAPSATLSPLTSSGSVPFVVNFDAGGSVDPDGDIIKYEWDFDGDGNFDGYGADSTISHTYSTPGAYPVRLRVSDAAGAQATALATVYVSVAGNVAPTAHFTRTPAVGDGPLLVNFDATGSSDGDGSVVRYDWDFDGDGGWDAYDSAPQVSHLFTVPGLYSARLRVTDDSGAQTYVRDGIDVQVPGNLGPDAVLVFISETSTPGSVVLLDASGSNDVDGSIVKYEWDFEGDGVWDGYGDDAITYHTYADAGNHTPLVRVSDERGAQDIAETTVVIVDTENSPPVASFTVLPGSGSPPLPVVFDASESADVDGFIAKYEWDFDGDGTWDAYGETASAGHVYFGVGEFTVTLRVTDDRGVKSTATQTVLVGSAE